MQDMSPATNSAPRLLLCYKTCFDIFYLITLLHAYLSNYPFRLISTRPPVISYSKKRSICLASRHLTMPRITCHTDCMIISKVLRLKSAAIFCLDFATPTRNGASRRCGVWKSECIVERNERKRGKQRATGKYIYIFREKMSCVNPIVEHFSFTV